MSLVYGFTVITFPEIDGDIPQTSTRVFATKQAFDITLENLTLEENEEVDTFETVLE